MLTVEVIEDLDAAEVFAARVGRVGGGPLDSHVFAWLDAGLVEKSRSRGREPCELSPCETDRSCWRSHPGSCRQVFAWAGSTCAFSAPELSDRVDILFLSGSEHEVAPALRAARCLRSSHPPTSPRSRRYPSAHRGRVCSRAAGLGGPGLADTETPSSPLPRSPLPAGPPEAWLAGRSRNFRGQIGRMEHRLERPRRRRAPDNRPRRARAGTWARCSRSTQAAGRVAANRTSPGPPCRRF